MSTPEQHLETLVAEAEDLFPIPEAAALSYLQVREAMAQYVDQELAMHRDVERLVGEDREMMRDNHRNHVEFMASVFRLNAPALLVRTLPWVCRSYTAHGFDREYFPVELAAWRRAVGQYVSPAEPIQAVYDWMIDVHNQIVALSEHPDHGAPPGSVELNEQAREILGVLLRGDTGRFLKIVEDSVRTTDQLTDFYSDVLRTVMYRIGQLWERDEISPAQEHLATAIVSRGMSQACAALEFPAFSRGRALVVCASHEFHELGARMLSDLLETDGWDVMFLGANLPTGDLVRFASQIEPHLVCISVTVPTNLLAARAMVEALREKVTPPPRIMVGGQALSGSPNLCEKIRADACPSTAQEARDLARSWWEETGSS